MFDKLTETEQKFVEFVNMLGSTALYQLGKIANPITGKIEQDLKAAKMTIDLLAMLKEKTKGNLTQNESKFLEDFINLLQMNYVEVSSKPEPAEEKKEDVSKPAEEPKAEPSGKPEPAGEKEKAEEKKDSAGDEDIVLNWEKHNSKKYENPEDKK